jgi:hypothetical protein
VKIVLFCIFSIFSLNANLILVSNKNINYNEIIDIDNLKVVNSSEKIRCKTFDINLLNNSQYQAKHFIFKNKFICKKDLKKIILNKIEYDFGNIVIQRTGKIIGETKIYIRIKNPNGKIEKIYKNGSK